MRCPQCKGPHVQEVARYHYHRYAFGRKVRGLVASRGSRLYCTDCRYRWKTQARVDDLPDAEERCCPGWRDHDLAAVIAAIEEAPSGRLWPWWKDED